MTDATSSRDGATAAEKDESYEPSTEESSLASRLANAEAQILALQDGLAEIYHFQRAAKQRALMLRVLLLIFALGAFFYMRAKSGG